MSEPGADREGERWLEHTVPAEQDGWMVRDVLTRALRLSKGMLKRLGRTEGVRLNGARPFLSNRVAAGDRLAVRLAAAGESGLRPVPMELRLAYEDEDVVVVDKPAGILVHPTRRSHVRTLAHGLLAHYRERGDAAGIHPVHRLDRDTSGLVLFAKHSMAHHRLDRQLRSRRLRRGYLALVHGAVRGDAGEIEAAIAVDPEAAHLRVAGEGEGRPARTRWRVAERLADATLLEVELDTGRTHQIRVHLAALGHPLVGDAAYGGEAAAPLGRQALHAFRLSFLHPMTREPVEVESPLPAEIAALLEALRGRAPG